MYLLLYGHYNSIWYDNSIGHFHYSGKDCSGREIHQVQALAGLQLESPHLHSVSGCISIVKLACITLPAQKSPRNENVQSENDAFKQIKHIKEMSVSLRVTTY